MAHELRTALNGRIVRYLEAGVGRPCILLHAFPLGADMWRPQLDRVPRGWRFIAPDLRGFGGSSIENTEIGIADYADDILYLMDALSIEQAVIGGLSMGGYIAFAVLRAAPSRISGLLLADTRSTADTDAGVEARRGMLTLVRERGAAGVADAMLPKLLGPKSSHLTADVRRQIEATSRPGIEAAIFAMMRRPDSTADLPAFQCPTLVVVGSDDTLTPPADAEALARAIPRAELVVISDAGHLSSLERPDEFSTTIARWLESLP